MQILLVEREILQAILNFVSGNTEINPQDTVNITLRATRGPDGYTAEVNIDKPMTQQFETHIEGDSDKHGLTMIPVGGENTEPTEPVVTAEPAVITPVQPVLVQPTVEVPAEEPAANEVAEEAAPFQPDTPEEAPTNTVPPSLFGNTPAPAPVVAETSAPVASEPEEPQVSVVATEQNFSLNAWAAQADAGEAEGTIEAELVAQPIPTTSSIFGDVKL